MGNRDLETALSDIFSLASLPAFFKEEERGEQVFPEYVIYVRVTLIFLTGSFNKKK